MRAPRSDSGGKSVGSYIKLGLIKAAGDVENRETQALVLLSLLFWVTTYLIFSIRSVLFPPDDLDLLSIKRLITTCCGAGLFSLAVAWVRCPANSARLHPQMKVIFSTATASVMLLLVRLAFNELITPRSFSLADHGGWILVWTGYFLAGLALASTKSWPVVDRAPVTSEAAAITEARPVIWVQRNRRSVQVPVSNIEWIEAQGNYVYVHAAEASGLLRSSLSSIESKVRSCGFVRVHRSALCQTSLIQALRRKSCGALVVIMTSGAELPVGRRYAANVNALISG